MLPQPFLALELPALTAAAWDRQAPVASSMAAYWKIPRRPRTAAVGRIRPVCRASKCDLRHAPLRQPGSMPFFFMTMAADGDVRNFTNAFAASGFVAPLWIPLENMVMC